MAVPQLSFGSGQVINPYTPLQDALGKSGMLAQNMIAKDMAEQQDKENAMKAEQLGMQKAEHQMKVDEQARQLAETEGYKKFVVGLNAPKEMSEASALYNQNNNPILQKQVNDMAFAPTDTPEDVARKTKMQEDLGKFGSTMSAMPEFKETEYQKGKRILAEMGDKAPLAGIKQLREMEAAQIASDAAKSKDLTDTSKHAQDGLLKLEIEAMKQGKGGGVTVNDDGSYTISGNGGGGGKIINPFDFKTTQTKLLVDAEKKGLMALNSAFESKEAGKAPELPATLVDRATKAYETLTAAGYDGELVAKDVVRNLKDDPKFYDIFATGQKDVKLTDAQTSVLDRLKKGTDALHAAELEKAQFAHMASQARNGGATGAEILKAYGPVYQNQIAKAEADKALLALTPEQRQAQATMSYLGKMMAPKADAADTVASRENATTFYKDGKVSYNKPRGYDDKPPTDNYGVKAITVKAVDGVKRLVDEKDRTSPYADLFAVSSLYESDGNSKATYKEKNGNTAEGLLQWSHPARKEALLKYVNGLTDTQYKSVSDVPANLQYKYFEHDITNGQYKHVGKALASAKTDAEKMQIITDMYEQPAYGAYQAKIRSEGMASYVGSTPKAIEKADREQFNLLLNKENRTAEDIAKLDSLSKILNVGLPKDGEWKPTFEDYTTKERGNKVNIQQLFADASSAPDAPVVKVLPPKSAEQERIDNSWSGQLTNALLVGSGGHTTWNNLGKVADQIGDNVALLGTAAVGGANRVGEFFTQPAFDAYNVSTGRSIGNPFAHAAVLAEAEHKRLLGKNSAVPAESIEQTMAVQQLLGPAAATKLGAIPAVVAEQAPYASAIGSRVLGNVAEGAQHSASKVPLLGRPFRPAATKPVLPAPATSMADDATIALKQDAVKETTTTGAKQASSREAELEARVSERIEKAQKLTRYEFLKSKETLDRIERRELDALEKLFSGK